MKKNITLLLIMLLSGVSTAWADWNPTASFSFTYNGNTQPSSEWSTSPSYYGGSCSAGTVSYVSGVKNAINCGTYHITLKNTCTTSPEHTGEYTFTWTITPANINSATVSTPNIAYGGSTMIVNPEPTVTLGGTQLVKGQDYVCSNVTVTGGGDYSYTITGIGNYSGTKQVQITVTEWVVTSYTQTPIYFNGTTQNVSGKINITQANGCSNSHGFVPNTNYTSLYDGTKEATNAGTYSVVIKNECSGHAGLFTLTWEIQPHNISDDSFVTVEAGDMTWTGSTLTKTKKSHSATDIGDGYKIYANYSGGTDLTEGTDFVVYTIPSVIQEAGTYQLVFEGRGNYNGTVTTTFNVKKTASSFNYEIPLQLKPHNGTAYTMPSNFNMVVKDGTKELIEGVDYSLAFSSNGGSESHDWDNAIINLNTEGKYKVTITGIGASYTGTKDCYYYIANEYQTIGGQTYHITSPGYPTTDSPTGAAIKGEMQLGAKTNPAISNTSESVTIPATQSITLTDAINFNVVGIESGAFAGCNILRWVDATALETYIPSVLDRTGNLASPFTGLPKQTLVFLYGSNVTGENYIYTTDNTNYSCDEFKIHDDTSGSQTGFSDDDYKWAFENPHTFTAKNIINSRNLKAGQHYTICLPYDMPIPAGVKAYTLKGTNATNDMITIIGFEEVADNTLTKHTPYVLIPSETGQLLNATNAVVTTFIQGDTSHQLGETTAGSFKMYGSMKYFAGSSATNATYIMQGKDANGVCQWKRINGGEYIDATNKACVLPMRAYITGPAVSSSARPRLSAVFNDSNGNTTAIDDLRLNPDDSDGSDNSELFDLQGRRVTSPPSPGIYIRNGKKIIVK